MRSNGIRDSSGRGAQELELPIIPLAVAVR
jgi:hypothetical protein